MTKPPKVQIHARIEKDLADRLDGKADDFKLTRTEALEIAILEWVGDSPLPVTERIRRLEEKIEILGREVQELKNNRDQITKP